MTKIVLKHGTGVPSDADLEVAEVAIDNVSGAMYTKLADDSVKHLNAAGASSWNDLTDKPADFPPSDHTHDIDDVNGLQDALDAAGGAPAWDDVTGKPTEFPPEAHTQDWSTITNTPSEYPPSAHNHDGVYQPVGNYIGEAPNDGEEYARKNEGWVKLQDHNYTGADAVKLTGDQSVAGHKTWTGIATFGDTVTMRGTLNGDGTANFQSAVTAGSFVKSGGTSDQYLMADGSVYTDPALIGSNLDGTWEYSASGPAEGQITARNENWLSITEITVHNTDANGYTHNFALMSEGDLVVIQTMDGGAEYQVSTKTPSGLTCVFTLDPVSSYGTFPSAGDSVKVDFIPQASTGSGIKPGDNVGDVAVWSGTEWVPTDGLQVKDGNVYVTGGLFVNGEDIRGLISSNASSISGNASDISSNSDRITALENAGGGGGGLWTEESPGVIVYNGTAKAKTIIGTG